MESTVHFLFEILRGIYPIPEDRREEAFQAFAIGLDFGLNLAAELRLREGQQEG